MRDSPELPVVHHSDVLNHSTGPKHTNRYKKYEISYIVGIGKKELDSADQCGSATIYSFITIYLLLCRPIT